MLYAIRVLVGGIFAVVLTALCLKNSALVDLHVITRDAPLSVPFYLVILGCVLMGFILGAFIVWLNGIPLRMAQRRTIKAHEKEITRLEDMLQENDIDPQDGQVLSSAGQPI